MGKPTLDVYPDGQAMILCTGCAELVSFTITIEDRRGGAAVCEDCLAAALELVEAHNGSGGDGGSVSESW